MGKTLKFQITTLNLRDEKLYDRPNINEFGQQKQKNIPASE
jgi:hypothetical protein